MVLKVYVVKRTEEGSHTPHSLPVWITVFFHVVVVECLDGRASSQKTGMTAGVCLGANKRLEGIRRLRGVGRIGRIGWICEGRIIGDR